MSLVLETAPAVPVVSAADMKRYLHGVAESETDPDVLALVAAATEYGQTALGQQFITATWELIDWAFPGEFELTPPLQSVVSIKYYDTADVEQTLAAAAYDVNTNHKPGLVCPAPGYSWPSVYDRYDAVTVQFKAGYGHAAADVPDNIVLAVKALAAHYYEQRGVVVTGTIVAKLPASVESLLSLSSHGQYA